MLLTYNGVEIRLGGVGVPGTKTEHVHAQQVMDDANLDYLYTRYTFDCVGVVNLKSMSYVRNVGNPVPQAQDGQPAALTVAAVRDALSQPRQQLVYSDQFGNVLLQSPPNNPQGNPGGGIQNNPTFVCDASGGPVVLRAPEIISVSGDKTLRVRVVIQTDLNESYLATANPPLLLSNRWSAEESLDDCAFSTLTYRSTAVFRPDVLATRQANGRQLVPDDFREYFAAFATPAGYKRCQVAVRQEPDSCTVHFQVVDEQRPVTLNDFRAMDIEVIETTGVASEGMEAAAVGLGFELLDGLGQIAVGLGEFFFGGGAGGILKAAGGGAGGIPALGKRIYNNVPRSHTRLVITAKGRTDGSRKALAQLCYVVLQQISGRWDRAFGTTDAQLTQDKVGKWVRLAVTVDRGAVQTAVQAALGNGAYNVPGLVDGVPDDDGINGVTSSTPGQWPPFPGGAQNRGTVLEALLTQVLSTPYAVPPKPPAVVQAAAGQNPF